jgi:hypothetical protein
VAHINAPLPTAYTRCIASTHLVGGRARALSVPVVGRRGTCLHSLGKTLLASKTFSAHTIFNLLARAKTDYRL